MTMDISKPLEAFEVVDFRARSFCVRGFWGNCAHLLSLLQPQVEGIAADMEHSADVGLLLTSVNGRNRFLPQVKAGIGI